MGTVINNPAMKILRSFFLNLVIVYRAVSNQCGKKALECSQEEIIKTQNAQL